MMRLIHYLFPPLRGRDRLPLPSRAWSSEHSRSPVSLEDPGAIRMLKGHGLAQTNADAATILRQHRGIPINDLVRDLKRKRRREPRLQRAWRKFKELL